MGDPFSYDPKRPNVFSTMKVLKKVTQEKFLFSGNVDDGDVSEYLLNISFTKLLSSPCYYRLVFKIYYFQMLTLFWLC